MVPRGRLEQTCKQSLLLPSFPLVRFRYKQDEGAYFLTWGFSGADWLVKQSPIHAVILHKRLRLRSITGVAVEAKFASPGNCGNYRDWDRSWLVTPAPCSQSPRRTAVKTLLGVNSLQISEHSALDSQPCYLCQDYFSTWCRWLQRRTRWDRNYESKECPSCRRSSHEKLPRVKQEIATCLAIFCCCRKALQKVVFATIYDNDFIDCLICSLCLWDSGDNTAPFTLRT